MIPPVVPGAPRPGERIRTLSGLAGYACGHTGSCCRAGWPIPIEAAPLALVTQAELDGSLRGMNAAPWLDGDILGHTSDNACVFHAPDHPGAGCRLETTLGSGALPFSCRQFPRVLLRDVHGWHMSVSAWCGTAAALLAAPAVARRGLVDGQPSFLSIAHIEVDARVHVEALDALDAWPPLLRPGVLAGHDAYARWEGRVLAECLTPASLGIGCTGPALATALCWTDRLRQWRAADGAFFVLVGKPFPHRDSRWLNFCHKPELQGYEQLLPRLMRAVPARWQAPKWPDGLTDASLDGAAVSRETAEAALARYVGTRLAASWVAYQGQGLRSVLASLVSAYALAALALRHAGSQQATLGRLTSAMRAADWLLLHLLDRDQWAAWCSEWETAEDSRELLAIVAAAHAGLDEVSWA